jgi:glycosyltransferase involved in cell wall biosynthesis
MRRRDGADRGPDRGRRGGRPVSLSVIMLTYQRLEGLTRTLESFSRHCDIEDYELIICDDGTPEPDRNAIQSLGADLVIWNDRVGYGPNANSGIRAARGEFLFHLEDDLVVWRTGPFLEAGKDVLRALPELGCVKYEIEQNLPTSVRAKRRVGPYDVEVLPFAPAGATGDSIFRYGNRPHLKHRRFHEFYGLYPEGYTPFETELLFARRVNAWRGPRIAWIRDSLCFWHLGDEYESHAWAEPRTARVPFDVEPP